MSGQGEFAQDVSRVVGGYEILGQLGEGGMATVYLARQTDLDRLVALKELRELSSSDPSFAQRFLREARMAASLTHPNIVTVHDYFQFEGTPFIAMEYIENGSLRPHIGHMSLAQVGGVMEGMLAGLGYAGERGIVHRDVKPENVMVSSDGRVKIADFGIAKARYAFQTGGALTAEGTALGTPNYMAPEQALAEEVGTWTDLYAVGIMAFEFFVGRPPFADTPQPLVVIMRQVQDPLPPVTAFDPRIDPRIASWIAWLTAKEHVDRPQTAAEAWDGFEEILIAMLGPRWQRESRLLAAGAAAPGAPVPPRSGATRGTVPAVAIGTFAGGAAAGAAAGFAAEAGSPTPSSRPTRPLGDPALAATVPPNPDLLGVDRTEGLNGARTRAAGDPSGPPNRRTWKPVAIALVAAGLITVLAVAALRSNSSGSSAGAPRANTATQPAAAPPPATPQSATTPTTAAASTPDTSAGT
ncbi:MAG: serine/threonine-protein kinase, partial [Thermoleophilaceae bacterium]